MAFRICPEPQERHWSRAQDEYALALGQFPDVAGQSRGARLARSRTTSIGTQAHRSARHRDSSGSKRARPLVIKGVIAAREGRFKEALELWRKAKALEPGLSEYRSAD